MCPRQSHEGFAFNFCRIVIEQIGCLDSIAEMIFTDRIAIGGESYRFVSATTV